MRKRRKSEHVDLNVKQIQNCYRNAIEGFTLRYLCMDVHIYCM